MAENLRHYLDDYLSIAEAAGVPAGTVYADVLAWKGAVSARQQAMRRMRTAIDNGKLAGGAALFNQLTQRSRELSNRMAIVPEQGHEAEHRQRLAELNSQIERLEQSLAALSGDFQRELAERNRTPADIQQCLPAGDRAGRPVGILASHPARLEREEKSAEQRRWRRSSCGRISRSND